MHKIAYAFLLALVFTIPWENVVLLPAIGTVARLVGLLALAVCLIYIVMAGRLRFHWIIFWFAAFTAWAGITLLWVHSENAHIRVETFAQLLIMVGLLVQMLGTEKEVRWAFAAYILGCYVSAISSVHNYLLGVEEHYQRFAAAGFDPNDNAFALVLGLAMAWYFVVTSRGMPFLIGLVYVPLGSAAVLLTGSRGGFLALLVASAYPLLMTSYRPTRWRVLTISALLAAIVGIALIQFIPAASWARIATTWHEVGEGTLNYRRMIWASGLALFDQAPLLGVGAANFDNALQRQFGWSVVPHNVFLAVAVEYGLLGFFLFLGILYTAFGQMPKMPTPERRLWYVLGLALFLAFMSLSWEMRKQTWLVLGLAAAHSAALARPKKGGRRHKGLGLEERTAG